MKIKIKRYKEIEQIALAESLVGILEEIVPTGTSLNLAISEPASFPRYQRRHSTLVLLLR